MKISAVIITLNEAAHIGRCIQSLLPVVDEVIVVDSFSSDETKSICEELGVSFFENTFTGYGAQKNFGIDRSSGGYILSLDADEALSKELQESIVKAKTASLFDAYHFNLRNKIAGQWIKHGLWYPDRKLRLWKKSLAQWDLAAVHEKIQLPDNHSLKWLKGDLLHYAAASLDDWINTNDKYAVLGAKDLHSKGVSSNWVKRNIRPITTFGKSYFLKLGFLDGQMGFTLARLAARFNKLKYETLSDLAKKKHKTGDLR